MRDIIISGLVIIGLALLEFIQAIIIYYWGRQDGYDIAKEKKFDGDVRE